MLFRSDSPFPDYFQSEQNELIQIHRCDKCSGKGRIVKSVCPHCNGKKVAIGEDTITVTIEKGMPEGHQIVFEQESDESPDTTPGDVIFKLKTLPHKRFSRKGNDLHTSMTITLLEVSQSDFYRLRFRNSFCANLVFSRLLLVFQRKSSIWMGMK